MNPAYEALERLRAGNERFATSRIRYDAGAGHSRRAELTAGQAPFAVILGCSDSRVPVELVFDQGLGDLFVIRVAGNVAGETPLGSIEFAAAHLDVRLVVVMGHTHCGAVTAAVQALQESDVDFSSGVRSIVNHIRPSVEPIVDAGAGKSQDEILNEAIRANVRAAADKVRRGSPILEDLVAGSGLHIVGANYSLENGLVEFFDDVPPGT